MSQRTSCGSGMGRRCHALKRLSPNSTTLTLRQSPRQVPDKVADLWFVSTRLKVVDFVEKSA